VERATSDSDTGTTGADGKVTVRSDNVRKPPAGTTWTFTVTNVTKTGMTWIPGPNDSNSITK
jgi:hypothetical protein